MLVQTSVPRLKWRLLYKNKNRWFGMSHYEEDSDVYQIVRADPQSVSVFDKSNHYIPMEWIQKSCANDSPVTLMPYTENDWGDVVSIKVLGSDNRFEAGNCVTRQELRMCVEGEERSDTPSFIQCVYSTPSDHSGTNLQTGLTGKPTNKLVFKLPTNGMFITVGSLKKMMHDTENKTWYALPLYGGKRRRIGNVIGRHGVGMNHGQVPGFGVYKLFTKSEILSGVEARDEYGDYIILPQQEMLLNMFTGHSGCSIQHFIQHIKGAVIPVDVESVLTKNQVDYKDPGNFIYIMNKTPMEWAQLDDGSYDLKRVYNLYMKWFYSDGIDCSNKRVTSIPVYPNLRKLVCSFNKIESLPSFPKLQKLFATHCGLLKLSPCPSLQIMDVSRNNLDRLPHYPNLVKLACSHNKLTQLPMLPDLVILFCLHNQIDFVPVFPKLEVMQCQHNNLTELPAYPKLTMLDCSYNSITRIEMMNALLSLECQHNELRQLLSFPNLRRLDCRMNKLTNLPLLPLLECVSYDKDVIKALRLASLPECYT